MIPRSPRRPWLLVAIALAFGCEPIYSGWSAHACALLLDGTVWCWGYNSRGQLGDGTTFDRARPAPVAGLPEAVSVSAGIDFTCASAADGSVLCWGRNDLGQLGDGSMSDRATPGPVPGLANVRRVFAGPSAACALLETGEVRCWGELEHELAHGTPFTATGLPAPALEVAVGWLTACALLTTGEVWCWGSDGQATRDASISTAVAVAMTSQGPCAVLADGSVGCAPALPRPAVAIGSGFFQTCAVLDDGEVSCWGDEPFGPLERFGGPRPFGPAAFANGASAVAVGDGSACALLASGGGICWGDNWSGQIGDGTDRLRSSAVEVTGLPGAASAVTVSSGRIVWDYGCGTSATPDEGLPE